MCIDRVLKVRLDKIARCLTVWGQKKNPAGIKLQFFVSMETEKKTNQRTKLSIYILDTIESESTTRFKNRSSDGMMRSDWLVDVSDDRYITNWRTVVSVGEHYKKKCVDLVKLISKCSKILYTVYTMYVNIPYKYYSKLNLSLSI